MNGWKGSRRYMLPLIALCLLLVVSIPHAAAIMLTFEDLPDAKLFLGGGENIGNFYPGLVFGPDVTGLSSSRFGYNDAAFPAHSPDAVITSVISDTIAVEFPDPMASVRVFYTSFDPLVASFFDASDTLLGSLAGSPNTDGVFGTSDILSFAMPGPSIARATFEASPNSFVLDDLTFEAASVPEPSAFAILATSLVMLLLGRAMRSHWIRRALR